jgi:hypothetical protein
MERIDAAPSWMHTGGGLIADPRFRAIWNPGGFSVGAGLTSPGFLKVVNVEQQDHRQPESQEYRGCGQHE